MTVIAQDLFAVLNRHHVPANLALNTLAHCIAQAIGQAVVADDHDHAVEVLVSTVTTHLKALTNKPAVPN